VVKGNPPLGPSFGNLDLMSLSMVLNNTCAVVSLVRMEAVSHIAG